MWSAGVASLPGSNIPPSAMRNSPTRSTGAVAIPDSTLRDWQRRFGATNSYDWCRNTYGTKWGTYESALIKSCDGHLVYRYQTAWSPLSEACLAKVSRKFPTLKFIVEFAERGMAYAGTWVIENGDISIVDDKKLDKADFDKNGNYLPNDGYTELVESSG